MFLECMEMFLNFPTMHNQLYYSHTDECNLLDFGVLSALVQALEVYLSCLLTGTEAEAKGYIA